MEAALAAVAALAAEGASFDSEEALAAASVCCGPSAVCSDPALPAATLFLEHGSPGALASAGDDGAVAVRLTAYGFEDARLARRFVAGCVEPLLRGPVVGVRCPAAGRPPFRLAGMYLPAGFAAQPGRNARSFYLWAKLVREGADPALADALPLPPGAVPADAAAVRAPDGLRALGLAAASRIPGRAPPGSSARAPSSAPPESLAAPLEPSAPTRSSAPSRSPARPGSLAAPTGSSGPPGSLTAPSRSSAPPESLTELLSAAPEPLDAPRARTEKGDRTARNARTKKRDRTARGAPAAPATAAGAPATAASAPATAASAPATAASAPATAAGADAPAACAPAPPASADSEAPAAPGSPGHRAAVWMLTGFLVHHPGDRSDDAALARLIASEFDVAPKRRR